MALVKVNPLGEKYIQMFPNNKIFMEHMIGQILFTKRNNGKKIQVDDIDIQWLNLSMEGCCQMIEKYVQLKILFVCLH